MHPVVLLAGVMTCATLVAFLVEGLYGFMNSLVQLQGLPGWSFIRKDWPHLIAAWFWLTIFSVAIIGFLINVSNLFRSGVSRVKDFSPLRALSVADVKDLGEWIEDNTYGPEHLKELFGERDHE